jgi:prolyl oligopeptidase
MNIHLKLTTVLLLMTACQHPAPPRYPHTPKTAHVDTLFGTPVPDPYRWLENDRSDSTAAWVAAQNQTTAEYLRQIPFRNRIRQTLASNWDYPRHSVPEKHGDKYYLFINTGLQNQAVLHTLDSLHARPQPFLDPNTLSPDGTTRIGTVTFSPDNRYLAYTLSTAGSDWQEIHLRDTRGNSLPDTIKWVKFPDIAWYRDGFFYNAYDPPAGSALSEQNRFNKICYHQLRTPQSADRLIYRDTLNPLRYHRPYTTDNGEYLLLSTSAGTGGNTLAIKPLRQAARTFLPLTPDSFDCEFIPVDNRHDTLYILTNHHAPNYRLLQLTLQHNRPRWQTLIPETGDLLLSVTVAGNKLIAEYLHNAHSELYTFDRSGNGKTPLPLPGIGALTGISGSKSSNELLYTFASFATPPTTFHIPDLNHPTPRVYKKTQLHFQPAEYITEQVWYQSKDGTKIPLFITSKKGTPRNGQNPTLLYGYGGFNIPLTPTFNIANMLLLESGGIYAVANLRGGGEFGSRWHLAGTKLQKQNTFDDFIAAAEYLINEKYTSPGKLAIRGASNGGLLVGAAITQRPELFRVALPAVGVMDMLRFHKFTVGWGWTDDYGSSEHSEEQFRYLLRYSPLHNIRPGRAYPATLITTADHDDRVVPAHSFKFAATLQAAQTGPNPVLIRIDTQSGHGASSTAKAIEEYTDLWAFTFYNLGMKFAPR